MYYRRTFNEALSTEMTHSLIAKSFSVHHRRVRAFSSTTVLGQKELNLKCGTTVHLLSYSL